MLWKKEKEERNLRMEEGAKACKEVSATLMISPSSVLDTNSRWVPQALGL